MKYLILGGAGFIGSYLVDYFLKNNLADLVRVYDNFSAGRFWHLQDHNQSPKLEIINRDIYDKEIIEAMKDIDITILLAANPDISKAMSIPDIDFHQGTVLAQITLEAMRKAGCHRLLYASGSGVYGDTGSKWVGENYAPLEPISTYGASKISCEALISSYCHMFGIKASVFRFGNVVGGRQTHGVAYDFIGKLLKDGRKLDILGDGTQSKPYVYIDDIIKAIAIVLEKQQNIFDIFNVAPNDFSTVSEIACIVLEELKIDVKNCDLIYGVSNRGWKGDVPIVRLVTDKIRRLGWSNQYSSTEAVRLSVKAMLINKEFLYEKT